jgi:hypothetical protein
MALGLTQSLKEIIIGGYLLRVKAAGVEGWPPPCADCRETLGSVNLLEP